MNYKNFMGEYEATITYALFDMKNKRGAELFSRKIHGKNKVETKNGNYSVSFDGTLDNKMIAKKLGATLSVYEALNNKVDISKLKDADADNLIIGIDKQGKEGTDFKLKGSILQYSDKLKKFVGKFVKEAKTITGTVSISGQLKGTMITHGTLGSTSYLPKTKYTVHRTGNEPYFLKSPDGQQYKVDAKDYEKMFGNDLNESLSENVEDLMQAFMKGKMSKEDLTKKAKSIGKNVATKKELEMVLRNKFMQGVIANQHGIKKDVVISKVKELLTIVESINEKIEVVIDRVIGSGSKKKAYIKLAKGKEEKDITGKYDDINKYNRNKQEDLEKLWNSIKETTMENSYSKFMSDVEEDNLDEDKRKAMMKNEGNEKDFAKKQLAKGKKFVIVLPKGKGENLYAPDMSSAKEMAKEYGKGAKVMSISNYIGESTESPSFSEFLGEGMKGGIKPTHAYADFDSTEKKLLNNFVVTVSSDMAVDSHDDMKFVSKRKDKKTGNIMYLAQNGKNQKMFDDLKTALKSMKIGESAESPSFSEFLGEAEDSDSKGDANVQTIIDELISTGWSGSNKEQMKASQLLKGLATSDDPMSNKFMSALDKATSAMKVEDFK